MMKVSIVLNVQSSLYENELWRLDRRLACLGKFILRERFAKQQLNGLDGGFMIAFRFFLKVARLG